MKWQTSGFRAQGKGTEGRQGEGGRGKGEGERGKGKGGRGKGEGERGKGEGGRGKGEGGLRRGWEWRKEQLNLPH